MRQHWRRAESLGAGRYSRHSGACFGSEVNATNEVVPLYLDVDRLRKRVCLRRMPNVTFVVRKKLVCLWSPTD